MTENSSKIIRIMAIIHLCIVFTVIASVMSYPFLEKLFAFRKQAFLYHYVMGDSTLASKDSVENQQKLERNQKRFSQLPQEKQNEILTKYKQLVTESEQSFLNKIALSFKILMFKIPLFERAWLFFSIIICILLLLNNENASKASWILPLIVICYLVHNQMYGEPESLPPDHALFPSEETIVKQYLKAPLSGGIFEQKEQLMKGWNLYLVENWTRITFHPDPLIFETQVEEGEYAFHLARLDSYGKKSNEASFHEKKSLFLLLLYLFWNIFFAYKVNKQFLKIERISPLKV